MKHLIATLTLLASAGCLVLPSSFKATPIPEAGVAQLTTCKTGDLSQIKKTLLLSGYSIDRADGDTLQTTFKQLEGGRDSKTFERISVIRVDDKLARFTATLRRDVKQRVESGELRNSRGQTIARETTVENATDERDMVYYEEERVIHEARRKRVCGNDA